MSSSTNINTSGNNTSNNNNTINSFGYWMNSSFPHSFSQTPQHFYCPNTKIDSFTNFDSIIENTPKKSTNQNIFPLIMNSSHLLKNEKENSFMKYNHNYDYQMMNESCGNLDNFPFQGSLQSKGCQGQQNGHCISSSTAADMFNSSLPGYMQHHGSDAYYYQASNSHQQGYQYNNYYSKTPVTGQKVQNIILQKSGLSYLKENLSEADFQLKKEVTDFSFVFPQPFKLPAQVNVSDFGVSLDAPTADRIEFENTPEGLSYQISAFSLNGNCSSTKEDVAQFPNSPSSVSISYKRITKRKSSTRKSTPQLVPMTAPDTNLITISKIKAPAPRPSRKKSIALNMSTTSASTILPLNLQGSADFSETIGQQEVALDQFLPLEDNTFTSTNNINCNTNIILGQNKNDPETDKNGEDNEDVLQGSSDSSIMSAEDQANGDAILNENSELSENPEKLRKQSDSKPCNCRNSKCLKRYCDCFAAGIYCNTECKCEECHNKPEYEEERQKAIQKKKKRIKDAFQPVILNNTHIKGCHCKNSHCQKKYCVCHQNGVLCSSLCQCVECENKIAAGFASNNPNPPKPQNQLSNDQQDQQEVSKAQMILLNILSEQQNQGNFCNSLLAESPKKFKNSGNNNEEDSSNQMELKLLQTIRKDPSCDAKPSVSDSEFSTHKKPPSKRRAFKSSDKKKALSFFNEVSPADHHQLSNPLLVSYQ